MPPFTDRFADLAARSGLDADDRGAHDRGADDLALVEVPWTLWGFLGAVGGEAVNAVLAGSTVPLLFRVFAEDTELSDPAVVRSFTARRLARPPGAGPTEEVEFLTTTGGTMLRYADGTFQQSWRTPGSPGSYQVSVTTTDGGTLSADFLLR